jgi:hypothetical protein
MPRFRILSPTARSLATDDRDKELADALATLATTATVTQLPTAQNPATEEIRKKLTDGEGADATITPLTSENDEQSQRGSNPCLHLERVVS